MNGSYSTHIYTEHAINTLNGFAENNVPKWFMYLAFRSEALGNHIPK